MKSLPLIVPAGCTLSSDGLADQLGRVARLAPAVTGMTRSDRELRVSFAAGVDRALVDELVATEQACCSFLAVGYDDAQRVLRIETDDERGHEIIEQLTVSFAAEGAR